MREVIILKLVIVLLIIVLYLRGFFYKWAFFTIGEYVKRKLGQEISKLSDAEINELSTHVIKHEWAKLLF